MKIENLIEQNPDQCFLGLKPADYKNAKFAIFPVGLEKTVSYCHGTKHGPKAIINASPHLEFYDEDTGKEPQNQGIVTLKPLDFEQLSIEESFKKIKNIYSKLCQDKKITFVLGGEHSITPIFTECLKNLYPDFTVLHFDAHADLCYEYEGSKYSHACPMHRIFEQNIPVVSLGTRSLCKQEAMFIKENNLNIFYAKDIVKDSKTIDKALSTLASSNVYISFDVDVFDPAIMPSTGTPEPGGLNWYHIMYTFEKLKQLKKNIIGFDLVELAPHKEFIHPAFTCAKLIYKAMAYLFN